MSRKTKAYTTRNKKGCILQCIYLNINSIVSNKVELERLIEVKKPALVVCSETCTTDNIMDSELNISTYKLIRCDSHSRHTGGMLFYIHKQVEFNIVCNKSFDMNMWCIIIKIKKCALKWQFGVIYHSPSSSDADFVKYLNEIVTEHLKDSDNNLIIGDFNINMNIPSTYSNQLASVFAQMAMIQRIDFNTRVTEHSATKIDLLFANNDQIKIECASEYKISDHETICFQIPTTKYCRMRKYANAVCWENYSAENLINLLRLCDISSISNIVIENRVQALNDILSEAMQTLTYEKRINIQLRNKWYDRELTVLHKRKFELYKNAISSGHWDDYNAVKKIYKKTIILKKKKYMEDQVIINKGNMKSMWKCLKDAVELADNKEHIKKIVFNGECLENSNDIANVLNCYFVQSIIQINDSIETIELVDESETTNSIATFELTSIELEDIMNITKSFKNKYGGKNLLSEGVIKDSMVYIAHLYKDIINESFDSGIVPSCWKISTIIPVAKVKNTMKPDELRPINTLPIDEKIMETVVKKQLVNYLDNHNIIIPEQSGFRKSHSCETALNMVIAEWKEAVADKKVVVSCFLDLKRAFETIDRNELLKIMDKIGIKGKALEWFRSYLSNRKQRTVIGDAVSSVVDVNIGLPQGSVLAPILFIIYINDIKTCLRNCKISLFADDALVSISDKNVDCAVLKIQEDLNNLYKWLCSRKLKLNIDKTKYMIFHKNHNVVNHNTLSHSSLKIKTNAIERVDQMKYLGVIIDEKLSFGEHMNHLEKKIAQKIGFMYRTCKHISQHHKILVYRSIIEPHFIYCPTILLLTNDTLINKLQIQQNKAMRLILKCSYRTSKSIMLPMLNWLSIKQLICYYTLKFIHYITQGMLPNYLSDRMRYNHEIHSYGTRSSRNLRLPKVRTEFAKKTLEYVGYKMYNELPTEIKDCENIVKFKEKLFLYCKNLNM